MNERQQLAWDTAQAVLESNLRIIDLTGEELIRRGRNPYIINEIAFQEKMRLMESEMQLRLRRIRLIGLLKG